MYVCVIQQPLAMLCRITTTMAWRRYLYAKRNAPNTIINIINPAIELIKPIFKSHTWVTRPLLSLKDIVDLVETDTTVAIKNAVRTHFHVRNPPQRGLVIRK